MPFASGTQIIVIEAIPTHELGYAKLSAHAHIRIDDIEKEYTQFNKYLTAKEAKNHPTIVINCDELRRNKLLANSFSTNNKSVEKFIDNYTKALNIDIVPWLNQYSNEQSIFDGLSDKDPEQWITSDRLIRYPVLLAILSKRREWYQFDKIENEFITYCEKPHAQVYMSFAVSIINGLKQSKEI